MRAATIESLGERAAAAAGAGRDAGMTSSHESHAHALAERVRAEADLIDAARSGDAEAFDEIVRRHMRRAFAVAYRLLGHRQDAEDVVQDAFLAALVKLETFDRSRPFGPWLLRIVVNRGINLRKARALRHTEPIPEQATSPCVSPHESAEQSELREALQHALAQLPDQQRWVVELFEIDGFTGPEIAEMLEMAEGTVRWHLHQARHTLRAVLGGRGETATRPRGTEEDTRPFGKAHPSTLLGVTLSLSKGQGGLSAVEGRRHGGTETSQGIP